MEIDELFISVSKIHFLLRRCLATPRHTNSGLSALDLHKHFRESQRRVCECKIFMFQFLLDKDTFLLPQMFGDTSAYKWNLSALDLHEHRESQPHAFACVVYNRLFISMSKIHFANTEVLSSAQQRYKFCL